MKLISILIVAASVGLAVPGSVAAADLPHAPGRAPAAGLCPPNHVSPLADLSAAEIRAEVDHRYARAAAAIAEGAVLASALPAFTWGEAAVDACARAAGYLATGFVDETAVSRCDCFHARMIRYMR